MYIAASDGSGEAVRAIVTTERLIGSSTIITDSVAHWPNEFVATSGTLDTSTGVLEADTISVFKGHLTGSIITIEEFAPGYSDEGHSVGQVVMLKPSTLWADLLQTALDNAQHVSSVLQLQIDDLDKGLMHNPYKFHAFRSGNQTISSGTWSTVNLNAEVFDTNSNFDTSTYKYTVPITGYYQLNGQTFSSSANGFYSIIAIVQNATSGLSGGTILAEARASVSVDANKVQNASCLSYLTAGDTITLVAYIDDTTTPTVASGYGATFLSGILLSV